MRAQTRPWGWGGLRLLARAIRWELPALSVALAVALVVWRSPSPSEPVEAVWVVRAVALLLVVGALPFFDDPSVHQVGAAPVPWAVRWLPRVVASALWVLPLVLALAVTLHVSVPALAVEAVAVLLVAATCCLALVRMSGADAPSTIVGASVLVLVPAIALLPWSSGWLGTPGHPQWTEAHVRWAGLGAAGLLGVLLMLRDPAAPMPRPVVAALHPRRLRQAAGDLDI